MIHTETQKGASMIRMKTQKGVTMTHNNNTTSEKNLQEPIFSRGYSLHVQEVKDFKPHDFEMVKTKYQGDTYAVITAMKKAVKTHVQRIDKTHYRCLETGEIKEYNVMTDKQKNIVRRTTLKRTFDELRGLLRCNFVGEGESGSHNQKFITLTYRENMTDEKRLKKDFEAFMKNLKRNFPHEFVYVAVMEPQGRGAWHCHLMLKAADVDSFWISKKRIKELWRHGNAYIEELKSDDIGAYYTAYFTGMMDGCYNSNKSTDLLTSEEAYEAEKLLDEVVSAYSRMTGIKVNTEVKKAHIKGARLEMYPKGFRFYRCSQNVSRPTVCNDMMLYDLGEEGYDKIYERAYSIDKIIETGDSAGEVENLNKIYKATYRKRRPAELAEAQEVIKSLAANSATELDKLSPIGGNVTDHEQNFEQIHIDDNDKGGDCK